ncbi:MAG: hypothetical protein FD119_138 [Stygiobacter sp.]|nr:MAG: hypothetical protein FD119_138 [Stygiobacter sp.]
MNSDIEVPVEIEDLDDDWVEDMGKRPNQLIPVQPIQHPLAEPVFETRDTALAILQLLADETPSGQGPSLIEILLETVGAIDARLQQMEARQIRIESMLTKLAGTASGVSSTQHA